MQAINGNNGQRLAKSLQTVEPIQWQLLKLPRQIQRKQDEAFLIHECRWSHVMLRRNPADVIYLNEADVVIGMELNTKPYKLRGRLKQAASILGVPPGTVARTGTRIGHAIRYVKR